MRRRPRQADSSAPPAELLTYTGSSNREALAWLRARAEWWDATHDDEHPGQLQWTMDAHDQVGDFAWCGSDAASCGDRDCMCVLWPEYIASEDERSNEPRESR